MDHLRLVDLTQPAMRQLAKLHTSLYRITGGRFGHRLPGILPMLLLDHVGAKSGVKRTTPLGYIRDGDSIILVASKAGNPKHPGWFHNLRANPETTIQIGSERRAVCARVATAEERARLWPKVVSAYRGYANYQERTAREIPLVILEPDSSHAST